MQWTLTSGVPLESAAGTGNPPPVALAPPNYSMAKAVEISGGRSRDHFTETETAFVGTATAAAAADTRGSTRGYSLRDIHSSDKVHSEARGRRSSPSSPHLLSRWYSLSSRVNVVQVIAGAPADLGCVPDSRGREILEASTTAEHLESVVRRSHHELGVTAGGVQERKIGRKDTVCSVG